eukprot:g4653.t1
MDVVDETDGGGEDASKMDEHKGSGTPIMEEGEWNATQKLLDTFIFEADKVTVEKVRRLLANGARVDVVDKDGRGSALIWALIKSQSISDASKVIKELLNSYKGELGPECIRNNNQCMSVLMFAIVTACKFTVIREIILKLVDMKVDIDATDTDNNTALIYAARYGQKNVCELLLTCGSDVNAVSDGFYGNKMTAMDYALNGDVQDSLRKFGGVTQDSMEDSVSEKKSTLRRDSFNKYKRRGNLGMVDLLVRAA